MESSPEAGLARLRATVTSSAPDASKVALVHLVEWLRREDYLLLDTQWMTDHLRQFGGEEITREDYFSLLDEALEGMHEEQPRTASEEQSSL